MVRCGGAESTTIWVQCLLVGLLPLGLLWRSLTQEQAARAALQVANEVLRSQLDHTSARVKSLEAAARATSQIAPQGRTQCPPCGDNAAGMQQKSPRPRVSVRRARNILLVAGTIPIVGAL